MDLDRLTQAGPAPTTEHERSGPHRGTPMSLQKCRSRLELACRAMGLESCSVADPTPYIHFPGTARQALTFYGEVFGCTVQLHTFEEFNRTDGPPDAIAHGGLTGGRVALSG